MLESVFVIMFAIGFVTFILALFDEWETLFSFIMCFVSILFFIGSWAGSIYIEVPNDTFYNEPAVGWIFLGLIIVNVVGAIVSIVHVNVKARRMQL
jgi:hypothetical protein